MAGNEVRVTVQLLWQLLHVTKQILSFISTLGDDVTYTEAMLLKEWPIKVFFLYKNSYNYLSYNKSFPFG